MSKKSRARSRRAHLPQKPAPARRTMPVSGVVDAERGASRRAQTAALQPREHSWLSDVIEWLRGKIESIGESRFAAFVGRLVGMPANLVDKWNGQSQRMRRARRHASTRLWSWDVQGVRMLKQFARISLATAVSLALLVVLVAAATRLASAVGKVQSPISGLLGNTATATTDPAANADVTINSNVGGGATMPPVPDYTLGMWSSNMTPSTGSTIMIYARLSHDTTPVPGVAVSISYNGRGLATNTNQDGIATFTIPATGTTDHPVTVDGVVSINGQTINAQTFYSPV